MAREVIVGQRGWWRVQNIVAVSDIYCTTPRSASSIVIVPLCFLFWRGGEEVNHFLHHVLILCIAATTMEKDGTLGSDLSQLVVYHRFRCTVHSNSTLIHDSAAGNYL